MNTFFGSRIRGYLIIVPLLIIITGVSGSDWIGFSSNTVMESTVQLNRGNWNSAELNVQIPGISVQETKTKGGIFTQISLGNSSYKGEVGTPQLPVIRKLVEVPYGAQISLDFQTSPVKTIPLVDQRLNNRLIPVQAPVAKLPGALEAAPFDISDAIYRTDEFIGGPYVRIQDDDYWRGHRVVVLEISPVQYNPAQNTIRFVASIDIQLTFKDSDRGLTLKNAHRYFSPSFDQLLSECVLNHSAYRDFPYPPSTPISYLIITHPDYVAAYQPFIDFKTMAGYDVVVADTTETGTTTTAIKNYILDAYLNWPNPPVYVLLGADTNNVPAYIGETSGSADDNQYTELEGTQQWTPDIMIGRFPIRSVSDLETILGKVLQFEQMTMPSKDYFKNSVWLASSDHADMLETTHEWSFDNHILPMDPSNNVAFPVYERLGGDTADFAFNVNSGRGIVAYSGHGYGDGSGTASVHFVHSDVQALTNVDKYGHVQVFACGTNLHDQTVSFGERWLLEANKGAVSYWGTSDSSYWTEDDNEQREIYRTQHEDRIDTLSAMYFKGLLAVYTTGGAYAYYYDIYNLMGDPSSDFVTRIPQSPVIDCPDGTTPNEQDFEVNVMIGSMPVQGAIVAVNMNGIMIGAGYTDASGLAIVHITPTEPGEAVIVVTGHNLIPTQKPLMIMAAGCGMAVLNRGLYNCNDTILIRLWDSDLNTHPGSLDTAMVHISSESEITPETVTLTEVEPDSGEFAGTIRTSDSQGGVGYLRLAHGDEITLHYLDLDCEGSQVDVYDTAIADCMGPMISNVSVSNVGIDTFTVSWTTDEESTSVLTWGVSAPPMTETVDPNMRTLHEIILTDLDPCTDYFFRVSSVDAGGNVAVDDNGGQYFTITTLQLMLMLDANMDSDPGWTYQGQWAWGTPTGSDGDPNSGYTGSNVVGYNLNGSYPDNMTPNYVTTNIFDCSGASQAYLSFWKWLGVESASYDHATVEVSNNGGTSWNIIWEHTGGSFEDTSWSYQEFDISEWAAGASQVQLRWGMGPTDGSVTYCGWNIDDVRVSYTAPCNVPILNYDNHEIDDSAGNNDGQINAGETIAMSVTLENLGLDATHVSATISTTNPHITITSAQSNYPNIPQSGTGSSITDYVFTVSTQAADGEPIPFTVSWMSAENSGSTSFTEMVVAPTLAFYEVSVIDHGDGDGLVDPGETDQLMVTLTNSGNGLASNVSATLTSSHPQYITIGDGTASFPNIPGGGQGSTQAPHFTISASPSTPNDTLVTFTLNVTAIGYTTTTTFDLEITNSTFAQRFMWNMDANPGWSAEGQWQHGQPQGTGGDPSSGYTGTNVYGYNLAGQYPNNLQPTNLTTTVIDCTHLYDVEVRFMRWLGIESATWDHASFCVSNNGTTWTTIWEHSGATLNETSWQALTYDISAVADYQPTVYLRWVMGSTDSSVTYCGWNIDDVEIWAEREQTSPTPTPTPTCNHDGDVTLNGSVTAGDAQLCFSIALGVYSPSYEEECAADCNGNGSITAGDAQGIFAMALGMGSCVDPMVADKTINTLHSSHRPLTANTLQVQNSNLIWLENAGSTDQMIVVNVMISNRTTPVDAFTMSIGFDTAVLQFVDCEAGGLNPEWVDFGSNEATPGVVTLAAYTEGVENGGFEIGTGSTGILATLTFHVVNRSLTQTVKAFEIISVLDDLEAFLTK